MPDGARRGDDAPVGRESGPPMGRAGFCGALAHHRKIVRARAAAAHARVAHRQRCRDGGGGGPRVLSGILMTPQTGWLLERWETMTLIRRAEERIAEMVESGEVRCPCHLYIGQEAVAAGVCAAL